MAIKELQAYELLREEGLSDIQSVGYLLRHRKSGARIMVIANDDDNKVFHITFRTPPVDSTGVAHILEHCSLCGSEKFPSKDPFVELVKGSLNTFLNAMTYPDKTMYPIASCNDKDFANLMDVYMDAVFHTNIYKKEEIFRQEGWNYHLENPEDEITYNGVVYNEMKGAYSSPEDVLDREILNALYPDTPYGFESGGDPQCIPDLKYEDFLAFHGKYYHPSNAYIYLYGNMDVEERLTWLDQEYLSKYGEKEVDSKISMQKAFDAPHEIYKKYSISTSESEEDNTYLSWNVSVGTSSDVRLVTAMAILEYALLSAPGAPLKQALLDAGIGKDILGSFESGIQQPSLSVVAKNANVGDKEKFLAVIRKVLEEQVKNGIDKKALLAGINSSEFRFREADYGSYPKGLMYGIDIMDSWLYGEGDPFAYVKQLDIYKELRDAVESDYYEKLVQKYLLDNTHVAVVVVAPEKGLTAKLEAETAKKLADFKAGLSEEQVKELVEKTAKLQEFQETPSTQEELEKIPMLTREDITKKCRPICNRELSFGNTKVLWHDVNTNGIAYLTLYFDLSVVRKEDLPYVGLLKNVLGMIDTEHYAYGDLFNEINMQTGGIGTGMVVFPEKDTQKMYPMFTVSARTLYDKIDFVFDVIEEILFTSKLDDEKRLKEIVSEQKSRTQMRLTTAGHSAAATRAMAYFSETAAFSDRSSGIDYYRMLDDLDANFETKKEKLLDNTHVAVVVVAPEKGLTAKLEAETAKKLADFKAGLSEEQVKELVEKTAKLQEFQETPSTQEELEKIPMLTREDITKKCRPICNRELSFGNTKVLWHDVNTNGIAYLTLYFDLSVVRKEDLPYVGLLKNVLGMIDTEHYAYGDLFNEINMQTGGIGTGMVVFPEKDTQKMYPMFTVSARTLYDKIDFVFDVIEEILFTSKLDDEKRLKEIVSEQKSRTQMRLTTAGHSAAATRAMAYFSETAAFSDRSSGIDYYRMLDDLDANFETKKEKLKSKLKELMNVIFRQNAMVFSVTAEEKGLAGLEEKVTGLCEKLSLDKRTPAEETLAYGKLNEGFQTSAKIQYVTRAGNYREAGYDYTGALRILKVIMSYEYLWVNVRVKGGAYGCMSGFGRNGNSYFASYRDPNLRQTNEIYEGVPEYVEHFNVEERDMTKYVIGTISEMDTPLTARAQGARSDAAYFGHVTESDLQKERDQVLYATQEDIRALAPLMRAILAEDCICVLGNEDALEKEKEMFRNLGPL